MMDTPPPQRHAEYLRAQEALSLIQYAAQELADAPTARGAYTRDALLRFALEVTAVLRDHPSAE